MAQAHTLMLQTSLWWQASHPACPLGSLCGALAVHLKQLVSNMFSQPERYMGSVLKCMLALELPNPIGRGHERAIYMLGSLSHVYVLVEQHA
eukprot:scaffold303187_cov23-Tisochrysis_lutea.AAC.1